jgi:hypothetical protein
MSMPGAIKVHAARRWWQKMDGSHNSRKAVLHAEGVHVRNRNGVDLAKWMANNGVGPYNFIFVPYGRHAGQWVEVIPAKYGSDALIGNSRHYPTSLNRQGAKCVQICLAGVVRNIDFTKLSPKAQKSWARGVLWLWTRHKIPLRPIKTNWRPGAKRLPWSRWIKSGWTCHGLAPRNDHTDGLGVDPVKMLAKARRRRQRLKRK